MLQLVQRKIKTNMYTHIDHQEYRHIEINFKIDIKLKKKKRSSEEGLQVCKGMKKQPRCHRKENTDTEA